MRGGERVKDSRMKELVFLEPNKIDAVPFTTSEVIAEFAGVKHHAIQQLITKHETDFKEFGQVAFEMRAVTYSRGTNYEKIFHLNEEQATLLMTYLKNTEQVRAFKKELVRQFYAMRRELVQRQVNRAKLLPSRRDMTDAIRDCIPESPHRPCGTSTIPIWHIELLLAKLLPRSAGNGTRRKKPLPQIT